MSPLTTRAIGRYGRTLTYIGWVIDLLMVNLAYFITASLISGVQPFGTRTVWAILNLVYIVVLMWTHRSGYNRSASFERILSITLREVFADAFIFVPVLYFLGIEDVSWKQFLFFYALMFVLVGAGRMVWVICLKRLRRMGVNTATVAIVGGGPQATRLFKQMKGLKGFGYNVVAMFGPKLPEGSPMNEVYLGEIEELENFLNTHQVDEVYFCSNNAIPAEVARTARACEAKLVQFYFVPQIPPQVLGRFHASSLGSMSVLTLRDTPLRSATNRVIKRAFDLAFSTVALVCCPIIFIPVAIAIKMSSPGPVFFKQKRTGLKGKEFDCYKFRSMKVNKDADTKTATRDDPRKTKVGDFLRRTSIDELPQFINVFLGDMSIVGPRPHMVKQTESYSTLVEQYMVRHAVKPGITGWAQINGFRGPTDELWQIQGRVEHDIWYIEHWSFLLDMKIMVRTIYNAIHGEENAF